MKFIISIQKRYKQSPVKHINQLMLKESGNFEKLFLATFKVLCTNIIQIHTDEKQEDGERVLLTPPPEWYGNN